MTQDSTPDSTQGIIAISPDLGFTFSDGRNVTMARLGVGHVLKAGKTIARIWPKIEALASNARRDDDLEIESDTRGRAGMILVEAILESNSDILELVGSVFGLNAQQMLDGDTVQLADVPLMVEALMSHPDLAAFLKNFKRLAKSPAWTEMQTRLAPNAKAPKIGNAN